MLDQAMEPAAVAEYIATTLAPLEEVPQFVHVAVGCSDSALETASGTLRAICIFLGLIHLPGRTLCCQLPLALSQLLPTEL